tara:strand:- start:282 stop:1124 length:843 start_codon:yes stop_codon:yes gene_type:complete
MKRIIPLTLLALFTHLPSHATTLTHRYAFDNNANDSIGSLNGTLTANNPPTNTLEAPLFSNTDIPDSANTSFATNSIELGMSIGSKASSVDFGSGAQARIFDGVAGSFSYWFKADQLLNSRDLVSNIAGSAGLRTLLRKDGSLRLAGAGIGNVDFTFDSAVTAGTWHHLVVAWDDTDDTTGTLKIALDGSIKTQTFTAGALDNPGRLIAGNFSDDDSQLGTQFDGQLFDLQIYQGMLSNDEIITLAANAGTAIPEPGHYGLVIGFLALGYVIAIRRRPVN